MNQRPNQTPYKPSIRGTVTLFGALLLSYLLYQADVRNVPVIAPWLDLFGTWIYHRLPYEVTLLPRGASMVISSGAVGFAVFVLATMVLTLFFPSSKVGRMENQMRDMQNDRRPPSAKIK
jgi:hypothetical protein